MGPDPPTSFPVLALYLSPIAAVAMSLSLGQYVMCSKWCAWSVSAEMAVPDTQVAPHC